MKKDYKQLYQELQESSISRIYSKIQEHASGAITAYRGDNSRSENQKLNKELLVALKKRGYSVTKVQGAYIEHYNIPDAREVSEPVFLVVNDNVEGDDGGQLKKDLFKLGSLYEQESVLIIPPGGENAFLLGTSKEDNAFPSYRKTEVVGDFRGGLSKGPFFSRKGGRKFAFEEKEIETIHEPETINGKRGWYILSEQVEQKLEEVEELE